MTVHYLDLTDYLAIATEVTALDADVLTRITNLDLADSALHAPSAGWAGEGFYPDFTDKAAVLVVRLAKNHPLPDGNKRAAWVALRLFIEVNGVDMAGLSLRRRRRGSHGRHRLQRVGREARRRVADASAGTTFGITRPIAIPLRYSLPALSKADVLRHLAFG